MARQDSGSHPADAPGGLPALVGSPIRALLPATALTAAAAVQPSVDDAFIVYRYVARFLAGNGLTFNDGEYVEGFTSLLWTILLALAARCGLRPEIASIGLNYLAIPASLLLLDAVFRHLEVSRSLRFIGLLLFALSFLHFKVFFLGLEFGVFSVLLLGLLYGLVVALDRDLPEGLSGWPGVAIALLAVFLCLARPESLPLLPGMLLVILLLAGRSWRAVLRTLSPLVPLTLFLVPLLALRYAYYGALIPNSVWAKMPSLHHLLAVGGGSVWREGVDYLVKAYTSNPGLLLFLAAGLLGLIQGRHRLRLALLFTVLLWQHGVVLLNGGDWMPYFRFVNVLAPVYILVFILGAQCLSGVWRRAALALGMAGALLYAYSNLSSTQLSLPPRVDQPDLYGRIGEALNGVWIAGDIMVPEAIGTIGYAGSNIYIHDAASLTQSSFVRDPSSIRTVYGRSNWGLSLKLMPAVVVLHSRPPNTKWDAFEPDLWRSYSFHCVPPLPRTDHGWFLYLIVRKDRAEPYLRALTALGIRSVDYGAIREGEDVGEAVCVEHDGAREISELQEGDPP